MSECKEVNITKHIFKYMVFGLLIGFFLSGIITFLFVRHLNKDLSWEKMHVQSIESIDRNCNECHLGKSFIGLFSNPVVAGNDNIVNKMMDQAKIKRW